LGLRVWFDEFTLRLGDSLSESIDRGLAGSGAGLVVISPEFMAKRWPKRELAGLVSGQVGRGQLILPVWLNVSRDEVYEFSPTIADTLAIGANDVSLSDLALRIIERVKPDLHTAIQRRLAYEKAQSEAEFKMAEISDVKKAPIRHERVPRDIANRMRIVREALLEVFPVEWQTSIDNFRRDLYPIDELEIWEFVTSIYLAIVNEFRLDIAERKLLYRRLVEQVLLPDPDKPWVLSEESPKWEQRASALSSDTIDPLSQKFGSLDDKASKHVGS
jgi:hypothetical protein